MGTILSIAGSLGLGKLILAPICYLLMQFYKKIAPGMPAWLTPIMPYVFGVIGAFATGEANGDSLGTIINGILNGGTAVAAYNLNDVIGNLWKAISKAFSWLHSTPATPPAPPPTADELAALAPPLPTAAEIAAAMNAQDAIVSPSVSAQPKAADPAPSLPLPVPSK